MYSIVVARCHLRSSSRGLKSDLYIHLVCPHENMDREPAHGNPSPLTRVSVQKPARNMKPLLQTNIMIEEGLLVTQARCLHKICQRGESHDRESGARGTGCELAFKAGLLHKEGSNICDTR